MYLSFFNDVTKVLNGGFGKLTFWLFEEEVMFVEDLKDLLNQVVMLSQWIDKDQDVIKICNDLSYVD